MERTPKLIFSLIIISVMVTGLGVYAYLQSREYLRGPVLTITEPQNGSTSTTSLIALRGTAKNVSFMTLNGRQIFTDKQGRFRESLLLQDGYNIMTLEAKDRFGHTETKRLELVYKPTATSSSIVVPAKAGTQSAPVSPSVIPAEAEIQSQ